MSENEVTRELDDPEATGDSVRFGFIKMLNEAPISKGKSGSIGNEPAIFTNAESVEVLVNAKGVESLTFVLKFEKPACALNLGLEKLSAKK